MFGPAGNFTFTARRCWTSTSSNTHPDAPSRSFTVVCAALWASPSLAIDCAFAWLLVAPLRLKSCPVYMSTLALQSLLYHHHTTPIISTHINSQHQVHSPETHRVGGLSAPPGSVSTAPLYYCRKRCPGEVHPQIPQPSAYLYTGCDKGRPHCANRQDIRHCQVTFI